MFFFFIDAAPTEIYSFPLHDALPISSRSIALPSCSRTGLPSETTKDAEPDDARVASLLELHVLPAGPWGPYGYRTRVVDRKSTRLNSSHANISYAVFCLKKKIKE